MHKGKLKVGIAVPSGVLGGAEQVLLMIAKFLNSKDNEVDLFFLTNKSTDTWTSSIKGTHSVPDAKKERFGVIKLLWLIFRNKLYKKEYDLFITSHANLTGYIGFLRKLGILKIKRHVGRESMSVFMVFSGKKLFIYKMYYKIGYSMVDLLICQTEVMKDQLIRGEKWLKDTLKIKVIPNPVNLQEIQEKLKAPLVLPEMLKGKKYIVSAGRFIPDKGFDLLIDAYKKVLNKYPELYLVIVGDGNKRNEVEEQIRRLKLEDKVFFPGWVDNVYPYFKGADLCVVSSRLEGFPNVLLQMMAASDRVVSTLCAGGIDTIEGIYTCEPNDAEELYNAIIQALSFPSGKRQLFDQYLQKNSIENYMETIESYLDLDNTIK